MTLLDDLRYALRQFSHAPGFTATAVLTVALGIGAITAIFTLVHQVMLKSLPVAKPGELYRVGDFNDCCVNGGMAGNWSLFSYDKYKTFRDNTPGFAELAAFQAGRNLIGVRRQGSNQPAESQRIQYVSGNYFTMFGIGAYAGRVFSVADDRPGADPVAIMSYSAWQEKYGRDPSVIGASFVLNGQAFTVVGVAPPSFYGDRLERNPAFWLPLESERLLDRTATLIDMPTSNWLDLIGRISQGADPKAIEARLQVELQQWFRGPNAQLQPGEDALIPKQTLHLTPGGAGVQTMRDDYESGLRLLLWISGLVLLIACANVANLMLVRAAGRRQQTAVRTALGASSARQIRQVLTESAVLALCGGVVGVGLAFLGTRLMLQLALSHEPVAVSATPSWPVLGFTFAVALFTGIGFGIAPAWMTARTHPADVLRGAHRSTPHATGWTQKSLVVAQAALSLVLLCAAGLLIRSLQNMQRQHFGFDTTHRYILHIDPRMAGVQEDAMPAFYRQIRENLAVIPGINKVAFALYSPMEGDNWSETIYVEGKQPPPAGSNQNDASWLRVSDDYFDAVGTHILRGRAITAEDTAVMRNVAVVNQTFAHKFFQDEDPIGKHFGYMEQKYAGSFEIVGMTEDTQYREATRKIPPMFFLAEDQHLVFTDPRYKSFESVSHNLGAIVLMTTGPVPGLEPQVRHALGQVNPNLAIIDFMTFAAQVDGNFSQQAMIAKLTSLFGVLALVLSCIGLYGVTAYGVERRTSEIGIRMALGADRTRVLALILRGALAQVAIGLAIGLPLTLLAGRAMTAQLFGIKPYAPEILLATAILLSGAAVLAAVVPARRAAALEPMQALRTE
jgi:predicted permease